MHSVIGHNIKRLRKQSLITQQQLADACSLSKGMISKIESGKVMPAIATLAKIAHAFNVKVSLILEESENKEPVHQSTLIPLAQFNRTDMGYRVSPLAAEYGDKQIQPLVFYANKDELKAHTLTHQGEECIYIMDGEMIFRVGDRFYLLKKGDFLYFDSITPHGIEKVQREVYYLNFFSSKG